MATREKPLARSATDSLELSEAMVLTRTRAHDLQSVRKLNCWASNIGDVSVVRHMPNLEVCSLSINKISSLRDFAHCHKLQELYVRTNNIERLSDVHYLKNLRRLRSLWLSENPCANSDNYRSSVLKTLPNLQKLDNVAVTQEELLTAMKEGGEIPVPDDLSSSSLFSCPSMSSDGETDLHKSLSSSNGKWAPPRNKREQRRRKIANAEKCCREDESSSTRSGEDSSGGGGGVGSNDDGSFSPRSEEEAGDNVAEQKEEEAGDKIAAQKEEEEDVGNDQKTDLSNGDGRNNVQLDEEALEECVLGNKLNTDEGNGDVLLKRGEDSVENSIDESVVSGNTEETPKCIQEEWGKNVTDINSNNNNDNIPSVPSDTQNEQIKHPKKQETSLLDNIRLDDSLDDRNSVDIVKDVSEVASIELEDLTLNIEEQVTSHSDGEENKTLERDSDSQMVQCSQATEELRAEIASSNEQAGSVDWEEYNRMRVEAGVKPLEKVPTVARSAKSDVNRVRNSNILQAVLTLLKELDKDSLDIVGGAVKARLDAL